MSERNYVKLTTATENSMLSKGRIKSKGGKPIKKYSVIGPGIVLAATGIGAGDLVTSTVAGAQFGISLAWAVVIGVFLKYLLTEGVGRFTLATGQTIVEGWRSLGQWTMGYFSIYVSLFGLIYGAAIATTCGLMMYAMFPIMPLWAWAVVHSVGGFLLIWFGRYKLFEKMITILVGIMFTAIVGSAVMLLPSLGDIPKEALLPSITDGSIIRIFSIVGGIGGTLALAAYGYWIRAKGWKTKDMVPTMRLDVGVAYTITGMFSIALMIVSAQFLYGANVNFEGAEGMVDFLNIYGTRFGKTAQLILNIGFWSAAFSSLIGSWNGIPYLFADFIRVARRKKLSKEAYNEPVTSKDPAYRVFLAWLTFPSLLLLLFNQPVGLVLLYAALGSLFLPFLAITQLLLLNSKQVRSDFRNKMGHNVGLVFVIVVFVTLGVVKFI